MATVLTILVTGTICCVCFFIGAKIGQKVSKGEAVVLPSVNPIDALRERRGNKEAQMQADKYDTILRNIERYDGTAKGQEDVR